VRAAHGGAGDGGRVKARSRRSAIGYTLSFHAAKGKIYRVRAVTPR
jgi:alpha-L-fucosidase 2